MVETPFVCLPYVGVDHNPPAPKNVRQGVMVVTSNAKHEKNSPVVGGVGTLLGVWNSTFLDTPVIS